MIEIKHDRYRFDEANHVHYIDDRPASGVTTVCGVIGKDALMGWGIWTALNKIKELGTVTDENLELARTEPERIKKAAGAFGTEVHAIIEDFNKTGEVRKSASRRANTLVDFYVDWFRRNDVEVLCAEANLFSDRMWVGGIVDMIVRIDGKNYIADIKTSKDVYFSHFVQMGGYHECIEEMYPGYLPKLDIEGYVVIHLPKKGTPKVVRKSECPRYRKAFKACLFLHKFMKEPI